MQWYLLNGAMCVCVCVCACVCFLQGRWRLKRFLGLLSGSSAMVVSKSSSGGLAVTRVWRWKDGGWGGGRWQNVVYVVWGVVHTRSGWSLVLSVWLKLGVGIWYSYEFLHEQDDSVLSSVYTLRAFMKLLLLSSLLLPFLLPFLLPLSLLPSFPFSPLYLSLFPFLAPSSPLPPSLPAPSKFEVRGLSHFAYSHFTYSQFAY